MKRLVLKSLTAGVLLLCGCVTTPLKKDATVCPEFRDLACATAPECSFDDRRGCRVCSCSPSAASRGGPLPTGVQPDDRVPR